MHRLLLMLAICSAACSIARPSGIIDADARMVERCEFLGDVYGKSVWGGLMTPTGIENAKAEACEKGLELGATHIVWSAFGGFSTTAFVNGKVYRCPSP